MSFSTSSRRAASCSLACWRVKVSFSFCEVAWASWPLRLEEPLLEGLHPAGALLQPAPERVDLVLGVGQLGAQRFGLGSGFVGSCGHHWSP